MISSRRYSRTWPLLAKPLGSLWVCHLCLVPRTRAVRMLMRERRSTRRSFGVWLSVLDSYTTGVRRKRGRNDPATAYRRKSVFRKNSHNSLLTSFVGSHPSSKRPICCYFALFDTANYCMSSSVDTSSTAVLRWGSERAPSTPRATRKRPGQSCPLRQVLPRLHSRFSPFRQVAGSFKRIALS